jgi:threonylcarbamoyladenosine tRNA methylthiotransferase MtaB
LDLPEDETFLSPPSSKTRAALKVQDGCDYHCSFCIIPFARGRVQSLPFQDIVREAEDLVSMGFKEIVLTGVNIGTYCSEESGRPRRFVDLVDRLQEVDGLARLRISSIEPNTVTDALLRLMSRSEVVCPHLHIPIQSASDPIHAAMRRKYRKSRLERLAARIRELLPEAGLGTDVIAGFPGETERDFDETLRFLESAGFTYLHPFPFSPREGTAAAKLADAVPAETVHRRMNILREVDLKLRSRFTSRFLGRVQPVLFEEPGKDGLQEGYTPNYLRVRTHGQGNWRGQIRNLDLTQSDIKSIHF